MLERNVGEHRGKAVKARRIGAEDRIGVLRDAIRRSPSQMRLQQSQLLVVETAM